MPKLKFFGNQELVSDCDGKTVTRFRNFLLDRDGAKIVGSIVFDGSQGSLRIHQYMPPTKKPIVEIDLDHRSFFNGTRPTHPDQNPELCYKENCVNVSDMAARVILSCYGLMAEINTRQHSFDAGA